MDFTIKPFIINYTANSELRQYVHQENKNFGGLVTGEMNVSHQVKVQLSHQA